MNMSASDYGVHAHKSGQVSWKLQMWTATEQVGETSWSGWQPDEPENSRVEQREGGILIEMLHCVRSL